MKRKSLGVRFYPERTARAVLAIWAAGGIALGAIPLLSSGDDGPVDRAAAAPGGVAPATDVSSVTIPFLGVDLPTRSRGRDRAFTPRVRTRLSGESETTTQEDDDTQIMVGV